MPLKSNIASCILKTYILYLLVMAYNGWSVGRRYGIAGCKLTKTGKKEENKKEHRQTSDDQVGLSGLSLIKTLKKNGL